MPQPTHSRQPGTGLGIHYGEKPPRSVLVGLCVPHITARFRTYLVDLNAEICGCPDFEHREENCKHIYAAAIASAKSASCAGCGKKVRRRELRDVHGDNLTFFEGDRLCPKCAVAHGVA